MGGGGERGGGGRSRTPAAEERWQGAEAARRAADKALRHSSPWPPPSPSYSILRRGAFFPMGESYLRIK